MTTIGDIYSFIDSLAPFRIQDGFDNSGLLVGSKTDEVKKVLISLDCNLAVADEAKELGCDLVLTHHPILFRAIKKLDISHPAVRLLKYGIGCVCAHTNLDSADYNISDIMCEMMGYKPNGDIFSINRTDSESGDSVGYGRIADVSEISACDLAKRAKEAFNCGAVKFVDGKKPITRVAFCSGAGGDFLYDCLANKVQGYITSEVKHHEFLDASDLGITVIDAGHFNTEVIVLPYLKKILEEKFSDVEFIISASENDLIRSI